MTSDIRMINNTVLFQFDQRGKNVSSGSNQSQAFEESTQWGFSFHNFDESTKESRWGTVVSIGPDVSSEIVVGMKVLIEALQWTNHIIHDGDKYWRTDDNHILAYDIG